MSVANDSTLTENNMHINGHKNNIALIANGVMKDTHKEDENKSAMNNTTAGHNSRSVTPLDKKAITAITAIVTRAAYSNDDNNNSSNNNNNKTNNAVIRKEEHEMITQSNKVTENTNLKMTEGNISVQYSDLGESYSLSASPSSSTDVAHVSDDVNYRKRLSFRHTLRIVLRNSVCAALARLLIGVAKALAKRGIGRTFWSRLPEEFWSLNPLKWAVVVGGFSSFRILMQILSFLAQPLRIPEKVIAFTSGCVCALPVLVMDKRARTELCMYAFVRAAHTFCVRYIYPHLPRLLKRFNHYDVLLMCASASQISYALMFAPSTLPPSYHHFLLKASMFDRERMEAYGGFIRGHVVPELVTYCWKKGLPLIHPNDAEASEMACQYIHEGYTCNSWLVHYIAKSILTTGLPLYGPLRVGVMLALDRKRLIQHPWRSIWRGVRSVITSSLFLALYVGCIMRVSCWTLRHQMKSGFCFAALCFLAGIPTLLEPKNRRMDLALYCCTFSLRSFILTQNRLGRLPYPRHWFVLLTYVLSASYLLYEYEEEPKSLHPRLYALFRLVLGEKKPSRHHHGNNLILIKSDDGALVNVESK